MSLYKYESDESVIRRIRNSCVYIQEIETPRKHWRFGLSIPGEPELALSLLWYRTQKEARDAGMEQLEFLLKHATQLEQRNCSHGSWEYHPRVCAESDPYWTCVNCGIVKFHNEESE